MLYFTILLLLPSLFLFADIFLFIFVCSYSKDLKAEDLTCNDPDVLCFVRILTTLAEFEDWRLPLSQILQPIPFPSRFIESDTQVHFATRLEPVVRQLAKDPRCEVHQCLVGVRQNKNGWLQIFATSHDSEMYSLMVSKYLDEVLLWLRSLSLVTAASMWFVIDQCNVNDPTMLIGVN